MFTHTLLRSYPLLAALLFIHFLFVLSLPYTPHPPQGVVQAGQSDLQLPSTRIRMSDLHPTTPTPTSLRSELYSLIQQIHHNPHDYTLIKQLLGFYHSHNHQSLLHNPSLFANYGYTLIRNYRSHLNDIYYYDLVERTYIYALECNNDEIINHCLSILTNEFGSTIDKSIRVSRLIGLKMEQENQLQDALELYKEILERDPTNTWCIKRISTLLLTSGNVDNVQQATKQLISYLKNFTADESAWNELLHIYLQSKNYELSKVCIEELLLFSSENYLYHTLYADLLYTSKQYELARQYYSQSIELNPTDSNIRAYYGVVLSVRAGGEKNGIGIDMYKLAMSRLIRIYKYSGNDEAYNTMLKSFEQSV